VVGALQFDVLADRIKNEYDVPVLFESAGLYTARWVESDDPQALMRFAAANEAYIADDHQGELVFLARNAWHLETTEKESTEVRFLKTREYT